MSASTRSAISRNRSSRPWISPTQYTRLPSGTRRAVATGGAVFLSASRNGLAHDKNLVLPMLRRAWSALRGAAPIIKRWNPFRDPTRTQDVGQPLAAKALLRSSPPEPRLEPGRAVRQGPPECSCPPSFPPHSRQLDQGQRASAGPAATFPITTRQIDRGPPSRTPH